MMQREMTLTVRYQPSFEEAVCAVRIGWRPKWERTPVSNELLWRYSRRSDAAQRLDHFWQRAEELSIASVREKYL
jgi:hypothetical protein